LDSTQAQRTRRNDQVEVKLDQFSGQTWKSVELAVSIAILDY
jgi:hypothetical protein